MATIGNNVLTLSDWAKRLDPEGKVPTIVELLSQTNEILSDMLFMEGNLPTGHRTTVRTGLPDVFWRLLNQGVQPSKSTTAQIDEATGMLEAWTEVDKDLAMLNGNTQEFRMSEAEAFIEAMNQEMASTLFYGNSDVDPEEFNGLAVRYGDLSAGNAQNILPAGGVGADNASIYLVAWGSNTIHGIFPKGSMAGLQHEDHGEVTVQDATGIGTSRMRAYQDRWQWKVGMALRDWRYVVRIPNIDVSDLGGGSAADLINLMIKAIHRLPSMNIGKPVFYMNRTIFQALDIQAYDAVKSGGQLKYEHVDGKALHTFRGIPIRKCDAMLDAEDLVV